MGNGPQPAHLLFEWARTWVPLPNDWLRTGGDSFGVLQNFHLHISPRPGGLGGAYNFYIEDYQHANGAPGTGAYPVREFLCSITDDGAASPTYKDENCNNSALQLLVDVTDLVAVIGEPVTAPETPPSNSVDVSYSMDYFECYTEDTSLYPNAGGTSTSYPFGFCPGAIP
ncbi:MAG TPA: hypothetical protein VEC38_09635 [Candidatus Binataceae bacterium]|nr:hypothetical protein [Candidatus Binataceae bacterium]